MAPKDPSEKRVIIANADEPKNGEKAFLLYEKSHPERGDEDFIKETKKQLAGLRGHRVKLIFKGTHTDNDTKIVQRFTVQRTVNFRQFADVFGPGSAYGDALHAIKQKWSRERLLVVSASVEIADADDEDGESDE